MPKPPLPNPLPPNLLRPPPKLLPHSPKARILLLQLLRPLKLGAFPQRDGGVVAGLDEVRVVRGCGALQPGGEVLDVAGEGDGGVGGEGVFFGDDRSVGHPHALGRARSGASSTATVRHSAPFEHGASHVSGRQPS